MHVSKEPITPQCFPGKGYGQDVAHGAMRTVATDQPFGTDVLLSTIRANQDHVSACAVRYDSRCFDLTLDTYSLSD